jgi:hypothetical protein
MDTRTTNDDAITLKFAVVAAVLQMRKTDLICRVRKPE